MRRPPAARTSGTVARVRFSSRVSTPVDGRACAVRDPASGFGAISGRDHDRLAASGRDGSSRKGDGSPVGDGRFDRDRVRVLGAPAATRR